MSAFGGKADWLTPLECKPMVGCLFGQWTCWWRIIMRSDIDAGGEAAMQMLN